MIQGSISTNDNSFLSKEDESILRRIRANQNIAKNCPQDLFFLFFIPKIFLNEYIKNLIKQTNIL